MPQYIFQHPETGKIVQVVQAMNDKHELVIDGVKYNRLFTVPKMSIDTRVDPFSKNDFLRKTNKRMSLGDMQDESAQLSEKRASIAGQDPLKQKIFDDYKKATKKQHPEDQTGKRVETEDYILEC